MKKILRVSLIALLIAGAGTLFAFSVMKKDNKQTRIKDAVTLVNGWQYTGTAICFPLTTQQQRDDAVAALQDAIQNNKFTSVNNIEVLCPDGTCLCGFKLNGASLAEAVQDMINKINAGTTSFSHDTEITISSTKKYSPVLKPSI